MHETNEKNNRIFYFSLFTILILVVLLILGIMYISNNYQKIDEETKKPTPTTYREVTLAPCDVSTTPLPNVKSNISKDEMYPYYAYTDAQGRVVEVEAETLYTKGEREGRLCSSIYPSNKNETAKEAAGFITGGTDDRGHLIADRFDGVSNAYNITAQYGTANKYEYTKIESDLAKFIENGYKVEDFKVSVNYKSIVDRRPHYYDISFKVNGRQYNYRLYNDGTPLESR